MPMVHFAKVADNGRVVVPEPVRKALSLEDGDYLSFEERGPYHFEVRRARMTIVQGGVSK